MPDHLDTATVGARIEDLIHQMAALGDSEATVRARELVSLLMSLYGDGLRRVLDVIRTESGGSRAMLDRLAEDGLVASLLVLHDLHPHPAPVRLAAALTALEPHLPGETRVVLLDVVNDVARVRVTTAVTGEGALTNLRVAIERAVHEAAPEIATVDIAGLEDAPLIQILRPKRLHRDPQQA